MEERELRVSTSLARFRRAQELLRRYIRPGESLVDELLAERRAEAALSDCAAVLDASAALAVLQKEQGDEAVAKASDCRR